MLTGDEASPRSPGSEVPRAIVPPWSSSRLATGAKLGAWGRPGQSSKGGAAMPGRRLSRSVRKRADEQLHLQAQILEYVNDAVVAIDPDKHVIFWGRGAEALYGIAALEALGKRYSDLVELRWPSPTGLADCEAALAARGSFRGEAVHVLPSGREIHVE